MADPMIDLDKLRMVLGLARMQRRKLPRVALQAMHDTLTDALLRGGEWPNPSQRPETFDAAELLADYLQRLEAAGLK